MKHCATPFILVFASALSGQAVTNLERGKPIEREIRPGQTHLYEVRLQTGDFVRGTVNQHQIPINVKAYFPDGSKIRSFNGPSKGTKVFRFVAEAPGQYRLELKAADTGGAGSYSIEVQPIQPMQERLKIAPDEKYRSPRLTALRREIDRGNKAALAEFWRQVEKEGAPLAEPIEGDDRNLLVTFLWRATFETYNVLLVWPPYTYEHLDEYQLSRLADTDLWYKTLRVRKGARFTYQLSPNDTLSRASNAQRFSTAQVDPLNPHRRAENPQVTKYEVSSIAELPGAPPQPWAQVKVGTPPGKLEKHQFRSTMLGNERGVAVYTPAGYDAKASSYPLLVLLDGEEYQRVAAVQTMLDNLIAAGRIPPVVAVLVEHIDQETRTRELPCNPRFADALHEELLPWVRRSYNITSDPRRVTIGGVSYGGLAAAYAALRHPDSFGNALCQSAAFWFVPGQNSDDLENRDGEREPNWMARQFIAKPKLPLHFFIEAGLFENDVWGSGGQILETSRHMRDVLLAKGYEVHYHEFAGGHDFINWRGSLADGLQVLLGPARQQPTTRSTPPGEFPSAVKFSPEFDQTVLRLLAQRKVPGASIAIIRSGVIAGTPVYGVKDAVRPDLIDSETLFQAASITKPITAMAVLQLVQQNRITLDQDVNRLLRSWKVPENQFTTSRKVTVREILSHTAGITVSGFPGYEVGVRLPTLAQILDGLAPANTPPIRVDIQPGTVYRYSGGGYTVLRMLLEDVSGMSFSDLITRNVLRPLGMTRSILEQPLSSKLTSQAAVGHDHRTGAALPGGSRVYPELAPDGLWTTPTDLAKFAIEIANSLKGESGRVVNSEMARLMITKQLGEHGLGFAVRGEGRGFCFLHGGGNRGFQCALRYYPNIGDGFVIMTNGEPGSDVFGEIIAAMCSQFDWPV